MTTTACCCKKANLALTQQHAQGLDICIQKTLLGVQMTIEGAHETLIEGVTEFWQAV